MQNENLKEKLFLDIKEVLWDSEALLKITAADVSDKTREIRADLGKRIDKAKVQLNEMQAELRDQAVIGAKKTDQVIRDNPYQSIGVALGLGVLVGAVLNRR